MKEILKNQLRELDNIADLESKKLLDKKNKIKYTKGTVAYMMEYITLFTESNISLNNLLVKKVEGILQNIKSDDTVNISVCNRYIFDYCKKLTEGFIDKHC
ncbi:MAG: hypothetical protein ACOH2V_12895 [Candidatus Saccharimonadaceae bacterium]